MSEYNLPSQRQRLVLERNQLVESIGEDIARLNGQRQLRFSRTLGGSMDDELYRQLRDLIVRIGEHHYQQLRKLDNALIAIDDGTFGICTDCTKFIEADLLVTEPTVQRCISCQRKVET